MSGYVVVVFSINYPNKVIGPMERETAEKLAAGYQYTNSGGGSGNAVAMVLDKP